MAARKELKAAQALRDDNAPWLALRGQWARAPFEDKKVLPFNPTPGKLAKKHSDLRAEWGESDSDTDSDAEEQPLYRLRDVQEHPRVQAALDRWYDLLARLSGAKRFRDEALMDEHELLAQDWGQNPKEVVAAQCPSRFC